MDDMNENRRYGLSWWDGTKKGIIIHIHESCFEHLPGINNDTPIVQYLKEQHKLGQFSGDFDSNWGYGSILERIGTEDGYVLFRANYSQHKVKPCTVCGGAAKLEHESCRYCNGTGERADIQWTEITKIRASLKILFQVLSLDVCISKADKLQLFDLNLNTIPSGYHCGGIYGTLWPITVQWLNSAEYESEMSIPQIEEVMFNASALMSGYHEYERFYTRAVIRNGGFALDCASSATGVYCWRPNGEILSHNMDTGLQQLTILAGLAAFHTIIEE